MLNRFDNVEHWLGVTEPILCITHGQFVIKCRKALKIILKTSIGPQF